MISDKFFFEKELSWLAFNERVLQEAEDKNVPIIERLRFLGIFSNNQDEFFKVRVSAVKRRILLARDNEEKDKAKRLLSKIQSKVLKLQAKFDAVYKDAILSLARYNIFLSLNPN